jgi:hypothetical protein
MRNPSLQPTASRVLAVPSQRLSCSQRVSSVVRRTRTLPPYVCYKLFAQRRGCVYAPAIARTQHSGNGKALPGLVEVRRAECPPDGFPRGQDEVVGLSWFVGRRFPPASRLTPWLVVTLYSRPGEYHPTSYHPLLE